MKIAFTFNIQRTKSAEEAEFDSPDTIRMLSEALVELGHEVELIDVLDDVTHIIAKLRKFNPDLIFNTAEGSRGKSREAFYPALFEMLKIPYVGSDPHACTTTLDKHLTKLILAKEGIRTPNWIFVDSPKGLKNFDLQFPVIIKPNFEGSSKGITLKSIHENHKEMCEYARKFLKKFKDGIIIEEFIDGEDITVPFLENAAPETSGVCMPCKYFFDVDREKYQIYDFKLKQFQENRVEVKVADFLPARKIKEFFALSQKIYNIMNIRDMGRIDYRMDKKGTIYFIEINALPALQRGASIYEAAKYWGIFTPKEVVSNMIESALKRTKKNGKNHSSFISYPTSNTAKEIGRNYKSISPILN